MTFYNLFAQDKYCDRLLLTGLIVPRNHPSTTSSREFNTIELSARRLFFFSFLTAFHVALTGLIQYEFLSAPLSEGFILFASMLCTLGLQSNVFPNFWRQKA